MALGSRSPRMNFGGGGTPSGPTPQQQALATEQSVSNAQLNLEENEQRKTILNALQGTRVFRGSALSRQIAGNSPSTAAPVAPPSANQQSPILAPVTARSLLDQANQSGTSGATLSSGPSAINTGRTAPLGSKGAGGNPRGLA